MSEMPEPGGPETSHDDAGKGFPESQPFPARPRRRSLLATRLTWRSALLVILGIAALRLWVIESVIVDGGSMAPTLESDEWVLVGKLLKPRRFSVATLIDPQEGETVIKRVVGTPGDTIEIEPADPRPVNLEGSRVILNGMPLKEPYATSALPDRLPPTVVPVDSYFVLGDNRDDSVDSRTYGPVTAKSMRGRALLVIYPPLHIRLIPDVAEPAREAAGAR
jgi:signal peptidase I